MSKVNDGIFKIVVYIKTIIDINTILVHKRCIFMTLDQYKKRLI